MQAIKEQNTDHLIKLISKLRCEINTQMEYGCTPLMYAVDKDLPEMVEFLIIHGARLEEHSREYTPLFTAAENGQLEIVELFLKYGANLTGEFYFNQEECLSIAAFKFCCDFMDFIKNIDYSYIFEPIRDIGENQFNTTIDLTKNVINYWQKLFEYVAPWIAFSDRKNLIEYTCVIYGHRFN